MPWSSKFHSLLWANLKRISLSTSLKHNLKAFLAGRVIGLASLHCSIHEWDRNLGWLFNTRGSNRGNILKQTPTTVSVPSFGSVRCRSLSTALQRMPPSHPTTVFKTHVLTLQVPWEHFHCHLFLSISNLLKPPSLNHTPIRKAASSQCLRNLCPTHYCHKF